MPDYGQRPAPHQGAAALPRAGERVITNSAETQRILYPRFSSGDPSLLQDPYAQHSVTHACVRAVARNIAQVPFLIRFGDEESEDVLRDGPWVELFDDPCPALTSRTELWELTLDHMQSPRGECFWIKVGGGADGKATEGEIPRELWPMSGELFDEVIDEHTRTTQAWLYRDPTTGQVTAFAPHEVLFLKLPNPANYRRGIGPGEAAKVAARQDYKASRWNEVYFDNDATPGGVLIAQKSLTPAQREAIRVGWDNRHGGTEKRRRIAVLEGGLDYKETGQGLKDMDFPEGRRLTWKEVMMVYGVPESELGLTENLNNATAQSSDKGFWTKTLTPYIRIVEDTLWKQLFKPIEGDSGSVGRHRRKALAYRLAEASLRRAELARRQALRAYDEVRAVDKFKGPQRKPTAKAAGDVWGEFDLSTVEALRENFDQKVQTGERLQRMGYPINEVNNRLDLGMEEQDWGDEPLLGGTMSTVDDVLNPPEPVVMAPPGAPGEAPDKAPPAKPGANKTPKPDAAPAEGEKQLQLELLRGKVVAYLARATPRRDKAWRAQLKRTLSIEQKFRSKFSRWLMELRDWQLKALARGAAPRDLRAPGDKLTEDQIRALLFQTEDWGKKLVKLEHANYVEAASAGIDSAAQDLGGTFAFDVVDPRVVDTIAKREKVLLTSTPETIQKRVQRSLEEGVKNGETIRELQERLKGDFNQFTNRRALMVARTEVAGVVNQSRNQVFQAEGVEFHEWVTARDEVVRDSHEAQDGVAVAVGTPFPNGLMYPGDPNGPPGEIINCRCVAIPASGPSKPRAAVVVPTRANAPAAPVVPASVGVTTPVPSAAPAPTIHVHVNNILPEIDARELKVPPPPSPTRTERTKRVVRDDAGNVLGTKEVDQHFYEGGS